eukprot:2450560-Karenia_brevis.AAC.1
MRKPKDLRSLTKRPTARSRAQGRRATCCPTNSLLAATVLGGHPMQYHKDQLRESNSFSRQSRNRAISRIPAEPAKCLPKRGPTRAETLA